MTGHDPDLVDSAGVLLLLQLADSGFPTGAFAHSGGVEALLRRGIVSDAGSLEAHARAYASMVVAPGDTWFVRAAHDAAVRTDAARLRAVAAEDRAARIPRLARQASTAIGASFLHAARAITRDPEEAARLAWVDAVLSALTPRCSVFGAVGGAFQLPAGAVATAHCYLAVSGFVAPAVRLGVVGPVQAQAIVRSVLTGSTVAKAAPEDGAWALFSPMLDVGAMQHESAPERLFQS